MNSQTKTKSPQRPSRAKLFRSVVTSTAIETGQSSKSVAAILEEKRAQFSHLELAV